MTINREEQREPSVVLREPGGNASVAAADLSQWRLRVPDVPPTRYHGERYYPLAAFAGLRATISESAQTLVIEAPSALFTVTQLDAGTAAAPLAQRSATGGFLNYTLLATHADTSTSAAGSFELGAFGRWGTAVSSAIASVQGGKSELTRLESTWAYAMPGRLATVHVGDAVSRNGAWGNAVRFGGVQYATDFATQPNLVLSPGQVVAGQATVPSTVDVFVNNALVSQQSVRPGPFSISNIAPISGSGSVSLVIRDELGREQVVTRPFYASPTLLRAGLEDFSFDLGLLRRNFAIESNDYGPWLASATYRRGLSERVTGEVRAEAQAGLVNAGVGADVLVGDVGVFSASAAAGHNPQGRGLRMTAGFERQSRGLSFNVRGTWASPRFRQVGDLDRRFVVDREVLASAGYDFGRYGAVALAYVARSTVAQPSTTIGSLAYSLSLERWGYLGMSLSRLRSDNRSTLLNALWTVPFGASTSAALAVDRGRGAGRDHDERALSVQRNLPPGEGFGYRLRASDHGSRQAEFDYQNRYGSYSVELAHAQGVGGERISVSGGIGAVGDAVFLSRLINDSFGLVRVAGYGDVRVYSQNQEIGRTDASGVLVIPRLLPYQKNSVRIEQADLPFDAEIDALDHETVPFARSGVIVEFGARPARGALLRILQEDGVPLPPGAVVRVDGQVRAFPVGFDGTAYVTGLTARNGAVASWRDHTCRFAFDYPDNGDPQPRLGPFTCRSVH